MTGGTLFGLAVLSDACACLHACLHPLHACLPACTPPPATRQRLYRITEPMAADLGRAERPLLERCRTALDMLAAELATLQVKASGWAAGAWGRRG